MDAETRAGGYHLLAEIQEKFDLLPQALMESFHEHAAGVLRKRNHSSLRALDTFNWFHRRMLTSGIDPVGKNVFEIGPGSNWGYGLFWLQAFADAAGVEHPQPLRL